MVQVRLWKIIGEQAEARYHAVPAPPLVPDADDLDFQGVAGFRALDVHRARHRIDLAEVEMREIVRF